MHTLPAYVGIILKQHNSVFLVKRHNTDWAEGSWNFPGGLVEQNETLRAAAVREAKEETAVTVDSKDFKLVHVLDVRKGGTNTKDIIGFYFMTHSWQGECSNAEPHRHNQAAWFDLDNLPATITEHALQAIQGLKTGKQYSKHGWTS